MKVLQNTFSLGINNFILPGMQHRKSSWVLSREEEHSGEIMSGCKGQAVRAGAAVPSSAVGPADNNLE